MKYGVCLLNFRNLNKKRIVIDRGAFIFSFFSIGPSDVDIFFAAL
jgi:hypothetical protein